MVTKVVIIVVEKGYKNVEVTELLIEEELIIVSLVLEAMMYFQMKRCSNYKNSVKSSDKSDTFSSVVS